MVREQKNKRAREQQSKRASKRATEQQSKAKEQQSKRAIEKDSKRAKKKESKKARDHSFFVCFFFLFLTFGEALQRHTLINRCTLICPIAVLLLLTAPPAYVQIGSEYAVNRQ
jgi:Flp pilus assembly protein TadB